MAYYTIIGIWVVIIIFLFISEIYASSFTGLVGLSAIIPLVIAIVAGEENAIPFLAIEIPAFLILIAGAFVFLYFYFKKRQVKIDLENEKILKSQKYILRKDSVDNPGNTGEYGEIYINGTLFRTKNLLGINSIRKGESIIIKKFEGNTALIYREEGK